jgi:hypothetical protein
MMFDVNFFVGLGALIIGNIVLRIVQELSIVLLSIHSNLNILTDKFTGRAPEDVADVSIGQFFGDMGSQIKQKQEQMRARAEAERQQYGQQGQQGGQQYQQQYQQPPAQQYAPQQQQGYPPPPQNTYGSAPTQPPPPPPDF